MTETFGQMLARLREARQFSQNRLALAAQCHQTLVSKLENGTRHAPARAIVLAFASALDLNTSETDRLLFVAGYAPTIDYQALWERLHGEVDPRTKWCPRCAQHVPVSLFSERNGHGGLAGYCRPCKAAYTAEHEKRLALRGSRQSA